MIKYLIESFDLKNLNPKKYFWQTEIFSYTLQNVVNLH